MTHNEKRGSALREAQISLFTGSIYGATHTLSGHPLDTIKSKMQIQVGYTEGGSWSVARKIWMTEGFKGFYRGCVAPLWGSAVYRGIMMSAYEFGYTWISKNTSADGFMQQELVFGLRPMVPAATIFAALARGCFENPIEYAKVMGQTGQQWIIADIYRGVEWQILRTTALLLPIFGILDICRRKTKILDTFAGNFAVSASASGAAYFVCWPLETLKNLAQSGTPFKGATLKQRIDFLGGPMGLFRGIWPGTLCGGLRNGCGMISMLYAQKWATRLGLRD